MEKQTAASGESSDAAIARVLGRFVSTASLLSGLVGVAALIGWQFNVAVLKAVIPGEVIIKPNAAVALILCGGSLWLLRHEDTGSHGARKLTGQLLASVVVLLGLVSLSEHVFGWNAGIDELLFVDENPFEAFGSLRPGLMAPLTALNFVLIGLALVSLDRTVIVRAERYRPAELLAFVANTGAVVGILDFALSSHTSFTHVALQTAVTVFLVSCAVVSARTSCGVGALLVSPGPGGVVVRRLWLATLGAPLLTGFVSWMAYSAGLLPAWGAITTMIVAMMTALAALTVWSGISIDRRGLERRQAEAALRTSEANLNRAQAIAHIGSWYLDVRRDQLTWSDEVFRIFGVATGTPLTYETFLALIHPDDRNAVDRAWTAAIAGAPYDVEHRIVVAGAVKWVRERAEIEIDGDGRAVSGVGTVQDITGRKQTEHELLRLNRALRALSLCNQSLIRATDEAAWLDKVCRVIVDEARFRFCWVGRAEDDAGKTVTAVAQAGVEQGYLEAAKITWADTDRGRGPTGTSIRTCRQKIVQNTDTDRSFAPWRDAALKRGYGSLIAIPLVVENEVFGALSIYAEEHDAFRKEEVTLLAELAADLEFGITTLRGRARERRAEEEIRQLNADLEQRVIRRTADLAAAREREATLGSRIQQMLLLSQPPANVPGIEMAALTVPSEQIDGDFYHFFKHENDCVDVIVADVMGKGVPAALLAAATKSRFLEALCHLIAVSPRGRMPQPSEIVTVAHADMVRKLIDLESFVTLSYARFDLALQRVDLVDCGHTGMMVVRERTGDCDVLHGTNLPLGISEDETFDQVSVPFEPGDLFVFYSDGITDIRNAAGQFFGIDRFAACVRANSTLEPQKLVEAIRNVTVRFSGSERLADDLTCVAVKVVRVPELISHEELEIRSDLRDLRRARTFIRQAFSGTAAGVLTEDEVAALELAVNEAVSNIMIHAYDGRGDRPIQLEADMFPDRVSIRLRHLGEPFEPAAVSPAAFDGSRESGFGVYLMNATVDEVRYSRDGLGRNCVVLTKLRKH